MKRQKLRYRTVIISDVHLGLADCKIGQVNHFLRHIHCDKLIMNGDIIDGWHLKKWGKWNVEHTRFFRLVLKKAEKHGTEIIYLRGNHDEVGVELRKELIARLAMAGISVDECGFTHLAYAQEIAGAMLRRQQAEAVVAARKTLVEGAVGMVEMALAMLSEKNVVELDVERRAAMVSNLMVVLCSERDTQPVVNAGSVN